MKLQQLQERLEQKVRIYRNAYVSHYNDSNNLARVPGLSQPEVPYWMMGFALESFAEAKLRNISPVEAQSIIDLVFSRSSLWVNPDGSGVIASFVNWSTGNQTWFTQSYGFADHWASGIIYALNRTTSAGPNTDRVNSYRDLFFNRREASTSIDTEWRIWDNWVVPSRRSTQ